MVPIVIHIPHASVKIPKNEWDTFHLAEEDIQHELLKITDLWVDELLDVPSKYYNVSRVVAPVSRLVCDVCGLCVEGEERSASGEMGTVSNRLSDGKIFRSLTSEEEEEIVRKYYVPHHAVFEKMVDAGLESNGSCLVIEMHSFPAQAFGHESDKLIVPPEVRIGFDNVHGEFLAGGKWVGACRWAKISGEVQRSPNGGIVPKKHAENSGVMCVSISIRRDLFMIEETGKKADDFEELAKRVRVLAVALASRATEHAALLERMKQPYKDRVALLWSGEEEVLLERGEAVLGPGLVGRLSREADRYAQDVYDGKIVPMDVGEVPRGAQELSHYREVIRRRNIQWEIIERLSEDGGEIESYEWDGEGENTSPGSSFYACVVEWEGFFAWESEVDFGGPFGSVDEAIKGMRKHCGLA